VDLIFKHDDVEVDNTGYIRIKENDLEVLVKKVFKSKLVNLKETVPITLGDGHIIVKV
jgi:hypothetical protein